MGKVLLVDDEAEIRHVVDRVLSGFGYEVLTAESGKAALRLVEREKIDVVLLDFFLPDMIALELLSSLRRTLPDITVVIITSIWNMKIARKALDAGGVYFLPKPIDFAHLLEAIGKRSSGSGFSFPH